MPALPAGTSFRVSRPSVGGLPGLPRCVLPVQGRRVRRPDPHSRLPPDPGGRTDRADVTGSEPSPVRRQRALDVGATKVVTPETLVEPPLGAPVAEPYAVIFECSGHGSAVEAALGQLDYAGTLVIVGTGFTPPRFNQNRLIIFELEIVGAYNYNDDGFQPAVDLLDSGMLPLDSLIQPDDIALSEVMEEIERLSRGEIPSKVIVRPVGSALARPHWRRASTTW